MTGYQIWQLDKCSFEAYNRTMFKQLTWSRIDLSFYHYDGSIMNVSISNMGVWTWSTKLNLTKIVNKAPINPFPVSSHINVLD